MSHSPVVSDAPPATGTRYRPEIEGLRAVAILLVTTSHIWVGRTTGGIDVFLVVSGYLITTTLVLRWIRTGSVSPWRYLSRIFSRVLPSAAVVLAAAAVLAGLVAASGKAGAAAQAFTEIGFAAVFAENWYLAFASDGYLSPDRVLNPVEHFWALSLQMQFYLSWLLIVLALVALLRGRAGEASRRRAVVLVIAAITVVSLAWSVYSTLHDQPVAYFDTTARFWEFGAGALVAIAGPRFVRRPRLGAVVSWAGLALVVGFVFVGDFSVYFPGLAAPFPVAGAILVLLGSSSASGFGAERVLGARPMVWLGGLAFGVYLWHWLGLSAFALLENRREFSLLRGAAILAVALLAAWLVKRFVEDPLRRAARATDRGARVVPLAAGGVVLAIALGSFGAAALTAAAEPGRSQTLATEPAAPPREDSFVDDDALADAIEDAVEATSLPSPHVQPSLTKVVEVWSLDDCIDVPSDRFDECRYGDPDAPFHAVILGDSVATSWFPAVQAALGPEWTVQVLGRRGCPVAEVEAANTHGNESHWQLCREGMADILDAVAAEQPDLILLSSSVRPLSRLTSGATGAAAAEEWRLGFDAGLARWADGDAAVVALSPPPLGVTSCGSIDFEAGASRCLTGLSDDWQRMVEVEEEVAEAAGVPYIDTHEWFCDDEGRCPWVVDSTLVRADEAHLTQRYAERLALVMRDALGRTELDLPPLGG